MASLTSYTTVSPSAMVEMLHKPSKINERFRELLLIRLQDYCEKHGLTIFRTTKNVVVEKQEFCYVLRLKCYTKPKE